MPAEPREHPDSSLDTFDSSERRAPGAEDLTGQVIDTYRIEGRIGAGGMGTVYRAHDEKLGRPVAIKLLPPDVARDAERLRRFRSEARAASSLNHPHILVIHDVGEVDGRAFIVTELVEGRTLRERLDAGPVAPAEAIAVATQVASALSAAHARGIVHRDIKPENVMIRHDGYVKVVDFGLAKLTAAPAGGAAERTEPGLVLGTPRYMAPEQARGLDTDPRTDVWSIGVVLYEMLAGRAPFAAATHADLIAAILQAEPLPLGAAQGVAEPLVRLVATALQKDPARRYRDAAELHAALAALRDSGGALPRPDAPLTAGSAAAARHTVGRDKERRELVDAFHRAADGRGHLLSISGDPGAGKTTLVESFLDDLRATCRIGVGRCSERLAGAEAYLPVLEAVDSLLHADAHAAAAIAAIAPTWHAQVSTAPAGRPPDAQAGSQERLKREIAALVRELSRAAPLVLFFDDVHWADASTIDLLGYLAPRSADAAVLVIVTSRPSDLLIANHPFVSVRRDLQARRLCHEVALDLLTRDDVARYLALECPGHRFPPELPALIHAKTEGSPLFMADLVRYLRANGTLRRRDEGGWTFEGSLDAVGRELPESVRGMIERKIAQVNDEDRALLTAASVQGYEFDSTVVAQALKQDAGRIEERLETLERVHRFVRLVDEREFPDRTPTLRYRFEHALYQNALYAQLRATRKVALSGAVAETIVRLQGPRDSEVASELAPLFEAAHDFVRAADYYRLAAQRAASLFASREAVVLAGRGVALLESLPETRERQERELALRVSLGNALIATRGYAADEVLETWTRAYALCEQLGGSPHLAAVLYGFAALYLVRGNQPKSLQYGTDLLALTEGQGDRAAIVGHRLVGFPLLAMGRLEEARRHFEAASAMYSPDVHRPLAYGFGHEPGMAARVMLGINLWLLGEPDAARRFRTDGLELARQVSHANTQGYGGTFAAVHDQMQGDRASVRAIAESVIRLSDEQGLSFWRGWCGILHGWTVAADGDVDAGVAEIRRGFEASRAIGAGLFDSYFLGLLADVLIAADRLDDAIAALDEADAFVARSEERFWESALLRLRGEIAVRRGDRAAAAALFERAIAVAERQGAKPLAALARASARS